ncbi:MAG: glycosyl transferase [Ruminococcaceae bacterium]|nr:glycosyl transferase [Oscillospiraceae bacterium]
MFKKVKKIYKYVVDKNYRNIIDLNRGKYDNLSDEEYIKLAFKIKMGKDVNLKNPKSFSEKLQWLKLFDHKPEYVPMVDKYEVKKIVADKIGEEYIIPTLGVWDSFDEIDFSALPDKFVLKCTHDSGGISFCRNKAEFDFEAARKKIEKSLKRDYFLNGREWPYKNVKRRIIAEAFMEDASGPDLNDYKFYCFNGEPKFLYLSQGLSDHSTASISYLNLDWTIAPFKRTDYKPFETLPKSPKNYDTMLEYCRVLSKDIPFLRVDFYEINEKLYFGELTFFPGSGFTKFDPDEWDEKIGEWLILPEQKHE